MVISIASERTRKTKPDITQRFVKTLHQIGETVRQKQKADSVYFEILADALGMSELLSSTGKESIRFDDPKVAPLLPFLYALRGPFLHGPFDDRIYRQRSAYLQAEKQYLATSPIFEGQIRNGNLLLNRKEYGGAEKEPIFRLILKDKNGKPASRFLTAHLLADVTSSDSYLLRNLAFLSEISVSREKVPERGFADKGSDGLTDRAVVTFEPYPGSSLSALLCCLYHKENLITPGLFYLIEEQGHHAEIVKNMIWPRGIKAKLLKLATPFAQKLYYGVNEIKAVLEKPDAADFFSGISSLLQRKERLTRHLEDAGRLEHLLGRSYHNALFLTLPDVLTFIGNEHDRKPTFTEGSDIFAAANQEQTKPKSTAADILSDNSIVVPHQDKLDATLAGEQLSFNFQGPE